MFSTDINFSPLFTVSKIDLDNHLSDCLEIRGIFEKEKDSFEWVPPAKLLLNLIFEARKAKKKNIYKFALKPPKLPEGPLWASSSRRVLSHHCRLRGGCFALLKCFYHHRATHQEAQTAAEELGQ